MTDWQPIETAPKDGRWMVLFCNYHDEDGTEMVVGRWVSDEEFPWEEMNAGTIAESCPTHWMPLPEPPESNG